jgi:uncharacterized membrane protein YbhN (UPF0104 family)
LLLAVILAFNTREIVANLSNPRPGFVLLGILLVQVQIVLSAIRWRYTSARLGHWFPLRRAVADYYLGSLVNMVLPGGVAGDVMRAARNRGEKRSWAIPVMAVMLERFAGQIALLLIGGLGLVAWPFLGTSSRPPEALALLAILFGTAVLVAGMTLLTWRFASSKWRARVERMGQALALCYGFPLAWLVQGILSVTIVLSYIAMFALASAAIGAPLPIIAMLTIIPACLLTMIVPLTIGGWGTREAAAAVLWPVMGMTASQGIAASVLYGLIATIGALPGIIGLVLPAFRGWNTRRRPSE